MAETVKLKDGREVEIGKDYVISSENGVSVHERTELLQTFMGKDVKPPIPYTFQWSTYDKLDVCKASEDWPNDSNIMKFVNQTAERSSKANSYSSASKDLRTAYEQTREFKVANLAKAFEASGKSAEEALKLAEQFTK